MTFLIDGYNLMHAVGLLGAARLPPGGLERARARLLDWLARETEGRDALIRVVFDARHAPFPSGEHGHRGVRVRFAFRTTADELIEELVNAEPRPGRVTVVSNDGQVREDARRRRCGVLTCQEFVDWVIEGPPPPDLSDGSPPPDDKPDPAATPDELAAWLAAFSNPLPKRRR